LKEERLERLERWWGAAVCPVDSFGELLVGTQLLLDRRFGLFELFSCVVLTAEHERLPPFAGDGARAAARLVDRE
jgi:hypothetical protein